MKRIALALSFLLIFVVVIGTSAQNTMPVLEGTDIKTVAKKAKEFGLSEPFGDENFGHGTKMKSLSNDSYTLMIDIIYSSHSGEILCAKQGKKKPALSMKEFNKQMTELINMRADGIINKETFLSKKSEIELLLKPSTITDSFLFETNSFGFISDQTILSFTKNIFIEKEKIKYFLKSSSKEKQKLIDSFTIKKIWLKNL